MSSDRDSAAYEKARSPHRFLTSRQNRQASPNGEARPTSKAGCQTQRPDPDLQPRHGNVPQFAAARRFAPNRPRAGSTAHDSTDGDGHSSLTLAQVLRTRRAEDVQESPPRPYHIEESEHAPADDEEMLDAVPSVENDDTVADAEEDVRARPSSPKRRKVELAHARPADHTTDAAGPSRPIFKLPSTPTARPLNRPAGTTPRFAPATAPNPFLGSDPGATASHPPAFLRPSNNSTQDLPAPLPETFSPHRRGQKFVPGAMAATLQQWVLETGQAAIASRRGQAYLYGRDYVVQIRIEEVRDGGGAGPMVARGVDGQGEERRVLLARPLADVQRTGLARGDVVGVRAPVWDVEVDGQAWTVGVDWRILS